MKIAILTFGHTGSSLPLAKALAENGCEVDFYFDAHYGKINFAEATDLVYKKASGLMGIVPTTACPQIANYVGVKNLSLKYVNTLGEAKSLPLLTSSFSIIRRVQISLICKRLNKLNYDVFYLIGRSSGTEDISLYCENIRCKIIVGLHEVCNHQKSDFSSPTPVLKTLFTRNIPIVVYSENSYSDIIKYKECRRDLVKNIPFGLFETYPLLDNVTDLKLPNSFYLYLGSISAYKGIPVLTEAINIINNADCKFVIAGAGYDQSLELLKEDDRVTIINRFLSNQEIAHLLRKAKAVICPYLTMSQSGIPQTAFAFGIPIIASNLDGFKEVINNGVNGLLFKSGDASDLAKAIDYIERDAAAFQKLEEGAESFTRIHPKYDWANIASDYLSIF